MVRLLMDSLGAGWFYNIRLVFSMYGRPLGADLGLCLVNVLYQVLGAIEGSRVKCAALLGLGEGAYTSKSNQDPESFSKMCLVSGLQNNLIRDFRSSSVEKDTGILSD